MRCWSDGAVEPPSSPHPAPLPQLPAVRGRHPPHDGRGRTPLSRARPGGLHGNLAGKRCQRRAFPPDHRPGGRGCEAAAHAERAAPLDPARRGAGAPDRAGVCLVRRGQAGGVPRGVAARAPRDTLRRTGSRRGPVAAPGEGASLALQAVDGAPHLRRLCGSGGQQPVDRGSRPRRARVPRPPRARRRCPRRPPRYDALPFPPRHRPAAGASQARTRGRPVAAHGRPARLPQGDRHRHPGTPRDPRLGSGRALRRRRRGEPARYPRGARHGARSGGRGAPAGLRS